MMRKIMMLVLSLNFILTSNCFATNWVYLQRQEGAGYGPCTEYMDVDSVIAEQGKLVLWQLWVVDESKWKNNTTRKVLFKKEIALTKPMTERKLTTYLYDVEGNEIKSFFTPNNTTAIPIRPGSLSEASFERIHDYAKKGQADNSIMPDHLNVPQPVWQKVADQPDGEIYIDIHSIAMWPQNSSGKLGANLKLVWNETGLTARKAEVEAQSSQKAPLNYADIRSTIFSYQFSGDQKKFRVFDITDYNVADYRITLLEGIIWTDVVKGSRHEIVLQEILSRL